MQITHTKCSQKKSKDSLVERQGNPAANDTKRNESGRKLQNTRDGEKSADDERNAKRSLKREERKDGVKRETANVEVKRTGNLIFQYKIDCFILSFLC